MRAIEIEEKSESFFLKKKKKPSRRDFNLSSSRRDDNQIQLGVVRQDAARKNVPLLSLGKKVVRVVDKGTPITPVTSVLETMRVASPATSVEEITPHPKTQRVMDKGREKVGSRSSSIWGDAGLALTRAHDVFTAKDLKVFSGMPSNEIVGSHIHKLVQVMYTYHSFFFIWFCA